MKLKFFALTALAALSLTATSQNLELKSLAVSPDGIVWVGTNSGLYYKPQDGNLQTHSGVANNITISDIAIYNSTVTNPATVRMLLATTKGAPFYLVNGSSLTSISTFTPTKTVSKVAMDNENAWIAGEDSVYVMQAGAFVDLKYKTTRQRRALANNNITGIALSNDTAYISTNGDPENYDVEIFTKNVDGFTGATSYVKWGPCPLTKPLCVAAEKDGAQWYGTKEDGVVWHKDTDYFGGWVSVKNGLLDSRVDAIATSPDGMTAYAGTPKGVSVVTRDDAVLSVTKNYSLNAANSNGIIDIAVGADNKVYAISAKGLYVLSPDTDELDPIVIGTEKAAIKVDAITIAPNPAADFVHVTIEHSRAAKAQINLLSSTGVMVRQLFNGEISEGIQTLTLPLNGVMPGNYICSLNIGNDYYASVLVVE